MLIYKKNSVAFDIRGPLVVKYQRYTTSKKPPCIQDVLKIGTLILTSNRTLNFL